MRKINAYREFLLPKSKGVKWRGSDFESASFYGSSVRDLLDNGETLVQQAVSGGSGLPLFFFAPKSRQKAIDINVFRLFLAPKRTGWLTVVLYSQKLIPLYHSTAGRQRAISLSSCLKFRALEYSQLFIPIVKNEEYGVFLKQATKN